MATSSRQHSVVLGIDIGSTNLKIVALDGAGKQAACSRRATPRAAHDPSVDATGLLGLLEEMILETCANGLTATALCVAGVGEDGVLVDAAMRPLGPALAWFDPRRVQLFDEIAPQLPPTDGLGVPTEPTRTLVGWAHASRQKGSARAHTWLALTDFAPCHWTGTPFLSDTLAARTAAWRTGDRTWVTDRVEATLGSVDLLPQVTPTGHIVGTMRSPRLRAEGVIAADAVIVAGGHDHPVGGWGVDLLHPGAILDSMGTAEVVVAQSPSVHTTRHDRVDLAPGIRHTGTTLLRVEELARNIEWASQDPDVGTALTQLLSGQHQPDEHLHSHTFIPGAAGAASPRYTAGAPLEPLSRASAALGALAAMGGAAIHAVAALTTPGAPVYAAGGWARSPGWLAARQAVTGTNINLITQQEVTAVGAALLAATAIGWDIDPAATLDITDPVP